MAYDDIINKYKKHLTKAQIKALADMEQKYRNLYSQQRAQALNEMTAQGNSMQRALQNMGLAGRHGKLISGVQKAGNERLARSYGDYHTQLGRAQNAQLERAAIRMANQTIAAQNAAAQAAYQQQLAQQQAQQGAANIINTITNASKPNRPNTEELYDQRPMVNASAPEKAAVASYRKNPFAQDAELANKVQEWQKKIARGSGITKPKNRNEFERMQDAERAQRELAEAQSKIVRMRNASSLPSNVQELATLDDKDFAIRYAAAEELYRKRMKEANVQESLDVANDTNNAEIMKRQATEAFLPFEQAKMFRAVTSAEAQYAQNVQVNAALVPKAPAWANPAEWDGSNWKKARDNNWHADDYERTHDTNGSRYAAMVNEWSLINGRTALLYTQKFQTASAFANLKEFIGSIFGGEVNRNFAYKQFRDKCVDEFYDSEGGNTKAQKEKMDAMLTLSNLMTDEERARFNTINERSGGAAADRYFEYLYNDVLPIRFTDYVQDETAFDTRNVIDKVQQSVVSVPNNLIQGVTAPINTMTTGQTDTVAARLAAMKGNTAQWTRSQIANSLGSTGSFLYQTGMSIADSATVAAISGGLGEIFEGLGLAAETASKVGSALGGAILGGSAFNSEYQDALDRGLTPEKARLTALGSGINEMLFETLSIETLLDKSGVQALKVSKNGFINYLANTGLQMGTEGSEEGFTDAGNRLWDNYINDIYSKELSDIRKYMMDGMSFDDAKRKVNDEFKEQMGSSVLGGALSGGVMGGGVGAFNLLANRQLEAYGKSLSQERIDELKKYEYKSEQAQEILNSDKITNTDAAMLDILHTQELVQESINYIEQAVADGKMPQEIADIYKKFAEHNVQTETNPDGITDEEAEKMLPYVDVIKNAEAIKQGLGKIVEQQTAARKEFDALSPEQKQQRLQNITNETTALRNAPSLRVGARESRLSGQSAAQEFTTRAKSDTITLNNDGSVKTANGSVTFDFGANKTVDAMTDNQARAIRFAAAVANKTGANIKVEQEFVGKDRNKNGEYDPKTNTIRVNLSGTNSAIYTISHELTHYLQANNKQAFEDLSKAIQKQLSRTDLVGSDLPADYQDILGDYLTGDNTLFEALCAYEKDRYAKANVSLTQAQVEEEVIARCCESFLGNSSLVADMTQNHTKSARAVYRFLSEIRADINALRSDASERMAERGYASDFSPEQGMLEQFADIDKIVKLWENGLRKVAKKNKVSGEKLYSLQEVEPVQPKSNKWQRTIDTAEAKRRFPTLWDVTADESEVRNPTQIKSTVSTYRKIYNMLKAEGFDGTILDASSGLGYGTKAGQEEYGFNVDDIEPYPDASYKPKYTDYSKLNKKYDVIISNAVLNVIPQDQRDALVVKMGKMLNDGGRIFINTRSKDVDTLASNKRNTKIGNMEWFVADTGSYQKGFTPNELQAYVQDVLGDGFTVERSNKFGAAAVIVTKKSTMASLSDTQYLDLAKRYESGDKSVESELRKAVDAAAKAAGYYMNGWHGTNAHFTVFDSRFIGDDNKLGIGFYFKIGELEFDYKNKIAAKIKIDNPITDNSTDVSKEKWNAFAKDVGIELSVTEGDSDIGIYERASYIYRGNKKEFLSAIMRHTGKDGIISHDRGSIVIFSPSQAKSADLVTYDKDGNIIPLSERFKTYRTGEDAWKNEDIRYSIADNVERKYTPETTMTMQQAKRMLEMTFNANGFRGYKGYKTADEWLQSEGAAEVAWYAENTETVVDQYFNRFPELTDYEVTIEEVLEAYQKGTLVGKEKTAKETIDLKTGNGYKDSRFYAPKLGSVTEETIRTANLRVTSINRDKVYAARRDVLFAAHTEEGIAALGLTQKELNKRLQNWSRYSERARTLSMKLNQGVAEEYWWTGLQNSSILSTINVTDQDILSLVKDIIGTSSEYQRNYIGRTMLALDTHIDWSELTFEFTRTSNAMEGARGYYDDNNRHIAVGSSGYLNTVAHEMGHALDYKWGRDLFTKMSVPITQQHASNESKIASEDGRKFYHHFAEFSQKVEDACDIRSSYTQRGTEAFARFVARFVEWTANTAGSQSNYEAQHYNDRFTTGLYLEFVQILQEKARLDSMARNETRASIMDKVRLSTSDGTRTFTYGDVTAKMYGNDVTLDGGKVRQRVQMLETLAERYDHVTVDASSEAEARAFENAGAKRVADEFSTGNEYGTYEFKFVESQFKRDSQFDAKQKANFAKAVLKQVGSRRNFTDQQMVKYRAALERAMTYLWNSTYGKGDQMAAFDAVDRLFDRILNSYSEMTEADADMRDALMSQMTKLKTANGRTYYQLDVTETQMSEILHKHDNVRTYTKLLSEALGARVVVKQVDGAKMLENTFTHATDSRIKNDTVEGNMPGELLRLAQDTMEKRTNPYKVESDDRAAKKEDMWDAALNIVGGEKSTQQKIREAVKEARAAERAKSSKEKAELRKKITEANLIGQMDRGKYREMVRRQERERYERKLSKLKEQAYTENKQIRNDLMKITKSNYERLVTMLAKPSDGSHVPVQLARETANFCLVLSELMDWKSNSQKGSLDISDMTKRGAINLQKLMDAYDQTFADEATIEKAMRENPGYDPRGKYLAKELYDESLYNMMEGLQELLKGKSIAEMDNYELRALMLTVRGVLHTVYDANQTIIKGERRATYQQADMMDRQLKDAKNVFGRKSNIFSKALNQYVIESLGLLRIAKIYSGSNENSVFVKMVDDLNQGAIEKERIALALRKMFDPVTAEYAKDMKTWYGKNAEWIDTGLKKDGHPVLITKGMRVSLAMHILNEQNLRNLEEKGVTIPNREEYRKGEYNQAYKVGHGMTVRMTKAQAQQIVSQMTEAEKAYFEVAKELFHKRAGYYINRTSLQLLGYAKATVENYFPIQVDDAYKLVEYDAIAKNAGVEHPGFLETRKGTTSVMYLNDITAVVNRQIDGVAKYAGLAIPMRNWNAVMNQRLYHEDSDGNWVADRGRVHDTLENEMGYTATKYNTENGSQRIANVEFVDQFIKDLAGHTQLSANDKGIGGSLATKLTSNYVKAVLLLNARVALSQAASLPTAAAEIPWQYIAKAFNGHIEGHMNHARIDELIDQYTPIFAMRRAGTQNEIADLMKRRGLSDKAEQKLPWLLGWITTMDTLTTRRLWYACEQWTAKETKIPIGSDAFYKEVAKRYERVIQNTQPNFTVLQRSPALRSQSPLTRIVTMFGTQRMQNGGIFIENAFEFAQAQGKEAKVKALRKMGRSMSALVTAAIMLGLGRTLVAMARGRVKPLQDDDKEVTAKSVGKYLRDDIISSLAGSFMFGSEIYDIVSGKISNIFSGDAGYDANYALPVTEALEAIVKFVKEEDWNFFKYMQGEHTDEERWNKTKSFVNRLMTVTSYLTGLPLQNASKTILNGIIPGWQDISDWKKTGEFNPWLHQSGKLDKAKTAANYKEWTKAGFSGRDYFYYEKMMSDVKGGREGRIPVLLQSDLTNEQKAMLMRMFDTSGATSDGTKVYAKNGDLVIDFAAPTEKQQALPLPSAEPSAAPSAEPSVEPTATPNPLSEAKQEGVRQAVAKGVDEKTANEAFLHYQDLYGTEGRDEEFRSWLFENVKSPENRAVLEYHVLGRASSVEGAVTYRQDGSVYRDYTNESWYTLSTNKSKRYEAGKRLEKTGLSVDKTVEIYNGLADYTKKAEWKEYLKKQGLTDEQITIFLWSRGWAKID